MSLSGSMRKILTERKTHSSPKENCFDRKVCISINVNILTETHLHQWKSVLTKRDDFRTKKKGNSLTKSEGQGQPQNPGHQGSQGAPLIRWPPGRPGFVCFCFADWLIWFGLILIWSGSNRVLLPCLSWGGYPGSKSGWVQAGPGPMKKNAFSFCGLDQGPAASGLFSLAFHENESGEKKMSFWWNSGISCPWMVL